MTEFQQAYRGMIKELSGKDWEKDETWRTGNAGIAIAASVLEDGNTKLSHLKDRIPDFTQYARAKAQELRKT